MADGLEDSHFTSVYDRVISRRAKERLERLGEVKSPTQAQRREIAREEKHCERSQWLVALEGEGSAFSGMDEEAYLSLVEWTGRNIRVDKPGYIPVGLESVLDRFDLDASAWAENVAAYGSLFHRIAGSAEQLLSYARRKGQNWFRGRDGSDHLYRSGKKAA